MYRFFYPPGEEGSLILASNFKMNMQLESGKRITFTANNLFQSVYDYIKTVCCKYHPLIPEYGQISNGFNEWYAAANQAITRSSNNKCGDCLIGLKVVDYNEYSATSCHINDEGQLVIRLSSAYWHHNLKSMVPNTTFSISTYFTFKFCDVSNGPYLAFPCFPTNGETTINSTAETTNQPSMYDILDKAGICLTPRPFDSTETGIYLLHGVTKKTIKPELILDNEMFKNKSLEIKFNILRKDSQIPTQKTFTYLNEVNVKDINPNQIEKRKLGAWMFSFDRLNDFLPIKNITTFKDSITINHHYPTLQCNHEGKTNEGVKFNLQEDDILIILPDDRRWNDYNNLSKAFAFLPYIAGVTTEQELNQTIKTAFSDKDGVNSFRFCVLNEKDKIHKYIHIIDVEPFQKPQQMLSLLWDESAHLHTTMNEICNILKAVKNNYKLVRDTMGFIEGAISNHNMDGILTLVNYKLVERDHIIGKFDWLQYIHQIKQIEKKSGQDLLFKTLMSKIVEIFALMEKRQTGFEVTTLAPVYKKHKIFINGHHINSKCTSDMFKRHLLTKKRSIDDCN